MSAPVYFVPMSTKFDALCEVQRFGLAHAFHRIELKDIAERETDAGVYLTRGPGVDLSAAESLPWLPLNDVGVKVFLDANNPPTPAELKRFDRQAVSGRAVK